MAALVNLDILIASGDRLHCLDILHALTRRVLGDVEDTEHFRKVGPFILRARMILHDVGLSGTRNSIPAKRPNYRFFFFFFFFLY